MTNIPLEEAPLALDVPAAPVVQRSFWRRLLLGFLALVLGLVTAAAVVAGVLWSQGGAYAELDTEHAVVPTPIEPGSKEDKLANRLAGFGPRGVYVVIDTYQNRLRVYKDDELLRQAVCSTGSGTVLKDPEKGRVWVFDTPLGEHQVQRKVKNPVWVKPDWAFIEEGYKPPPKTSDARYDDFSLGDYALYLGDGYLIHGTVFQTLLGRRVTHGCVRLGDADLEYVYKTVPLGARVYIF
jgi:L,D-transpeptidase ErfK/SrfK